MATTSDLLAQMSTLQVLLQEAGAHDTYERLNRGYVELRRAGASTAEAMLDLLQEPDGTCEEGTGAPNYRSIAVPECCAAELTALLEAAAAAQLLQAQVEAAEAKAGWDPNP